MIYIVIYFNGEEWIEFLSFTVEEYAINFMNRMKEEYPHLHVSVRHRMKDENEVIFPIMVDIAKNVTFD